jgi:hypothetical protein
MFHNNLSLTATTAFNKPQYFDGIFFVPTVLQLIAISQSKPGHTNHRHNGSVWLTLPNVNLPSAGIL